MRDVLGLIVNADKLAACASSGRSLTGVYRIISSSTSQRGNVRLRTGFRRGRPVVDVYARCTIKAGEQLVCYYGEKYWQQMKNVPIMLTYKYDFFWRDGEVIDEKNECLRALLQCKVGLDSKPFLIDVSTLTVANFLYGTEQGPGILQQREAIALAFSKKPFTRKMAHRASSP